MVNERNYTNNIDLVLPKDTDQYNVADFNDNMQKIDDFAGLIPARALTADKLTVGRNINGVLFDGTEDITIPPSGADIDFSNVSENAEQHIDSVTARKLTTTAYTQEQYPDEYSYWVEQAHSTFDLSKFEVVGSPTISEDGIASGFSGRNYVTLSQILSLNVSSFAVFCKVHTSSDITSQQMFWNSNGNINGVRVGVFQNNWLFTIGFSDGTSLQAFNKGELLAPNSDYYILFTLDNNEYAIKVSLTNNIKWTTIYSGTIDKPLVKSTQKWQIGAYSGSNYLRGSIDLKYFQIIKNGEIVVDGRKTAIDTIKAPDYTVVGNPSISADGIASGFSNSAYIIPSLMPFSSNNWGFEATFIPQNNPVDDKNQCIFTITNNFTVATNRYGTKIIITLQDLDAAQILLSTSEIGNLNINLINKVKVIYANQIFYCYINGELAYNKTVDLDNFKFSNNDQIIGYTLPPGYATFYGPIDLNSIKFYSNGSLIYQPCLYIPYTETTDGTKIVDAAYYDRVQSCREQTGQALYLTLDEQNQAYYLPQGTVSGMISQNKQKIDELDTTLTADILQAMPVGASIAYEGTRAPDGWFAESGTEIQQSAYPLLYAVVGDKYNLETTQEGYFRLPDTNISSRFYEGSTTPGTLTDAGLPNITGQFQNNGHMRNGGQCSGAFYVTQSNGLPSNQGSQNDGGIYGFQASRSNSIYGKSSTVQPKSITKFFIIKHD